MNNSASLPQYWYTVAKEIIADARKHVHIEDFKINAKLKPYKIGDSYRYRTDVLKQLLDYGAVILKDDRLHVGNTDNISWMQDALRNGLSDAWDFVEYVEGRCSEDKKFNQEILKEIGDSGEQFVIESLKERLPEEIHDEIIHIAEKDDTAGFDILSPSVRDIEQKFKIEVKTSTRTSPEGAEFFISRNEFETGKKNRNWCIVFVSINNGIFRIKGHIYCYQIDSRLPKDVDETARWQSCKVFVESRLLRKDLP